MQIASRSSSGSGGIFVKIFRSSFRSNYLPKFSKKTILSQKAQQARMYLFSQNFYLRQRICFFRNRHRSRGYDDVWQKLGKRLKNDERKLKMNSQRNSKIVFQLIVLQKIFSNEFHPMWVSSGLNDLYFMRTSLPLIWFNNIFTSQDNPYFSV